MVGLVIGLVQLQQVQRGVDLLGQAHLCDQAGDHPHAAVGRASDPLGQLVGDVRPSEHRALRVYNHRFVEASGDLPPFALEPPGQPSCRDHSIVFLLPGRRCGMLGAMTTASDARLASYERRYRELAGQLARIGYIASGSVALRSNRCGKDNCACHGDPPRLHGPYWHFTAKVDGKTVNKRLSDREARLYEEWIANDRKARDLLAEMRALAAKAAPLILAQEEPSTAGGIDGRDRKRRSPESARRSSLRRS